MAGPRFLVTLGDPRALRARSGAATRAPSARGLALPPRRLVPFLLLGLLPLSAAAASGAQPESTERAARVRLAVERGVAFLERNTAAQAFDRYASDYPGGVACLAFYTLTVCDAEARADGPLAELEREVRRAAVEEDHTYTLALALLGLLASGAADGDLARLLVRRLEAGQERQGAAGRRQRFGPGAWGYQVPRIAVRAAGAPLRPVAHWNAPQDHVDNSNSQFAVLALRAAADRGMEVDEEVFRRAAQHFLAVQGTDGGFGYAAEHRPSPYIAMTAGAGGALLMCSEALGGEDGELKRAAQRGVERAARWLARRTLFPPSGAPWPYYAAYSVERMGHYADLEQLGVRDWYGQGAEWLLSVQREDGSWPDPDHLAGAAATPRGQGGKGRRRDQARAADAPASLSGTCFALLFLRRASAVHTRTSDEVAVLLRGLSVQPLDAELERVRGRILGAGARAVPELVKALYLPSPAVRRLADSCLQELTGADQGYQNARTPEEERRAREGWVRHLLGGGRAP